MKRLKIERYGRYYMAIITKTILNAWGLKEGDYILAKKMKKQPVKPVQITDTGIVKFDMTHD